MGDGASVEQSLYAPASAAKNTCLVLLPALGVAASYYTGFARALADSGFTVALADHRGGPGGSVRAKEGGDFGYGTLVDDLCCMLTDLRARLPGTDVIPFGHSLGAQVIVAAANRHPQAFTRMVLVASSTPWVGAFPLKAALKIRVGAAVSVIGRVIGHYPGALVGFGGDEAKTLMQDWATFALRGTLPGQERAHAVPSAAGKRVLSLSVEDDWMTPPRAVDHLLSFLPGATIERGVVGGRELERRYRDHIRWLKQPDAVVARVARWVEDDSRRGDSQEDRRA